MLILGGVEAESGARLPNSSVETTSMSPWGNSLGERAHRNVRRGKQASCTWGMPDGAATRSIHNRLAGAALTKSTGRKLQTCEPKRGNVRYQFGHPGVLSSFRYKICTLEGCTNNFQSCRHRDVHELQLLHNSCKHGFRSISATCSPFHFPSAVSMSRNCICCLQCR